MKSLLKKLCIGMALCAAPTAAAGVQWEPGLRIFLEEKYDQDATVTADRVLPAGMLMSKVSPRLLLDVRDHTLTVESWYSADFMYRHSEGSQNSLLPDHRGQVTLQKLLTERLRVDADVRIWRVTDPTALPRLGMARPNAPVFYTRGDTSMSYRITERITGRGGYRLEATRIDDPNGLGVGFVHAPYAEGWYRLTRRMDLGVEYRYQRFLFERQLPAGLQFEHGYSNTVGAAARYRLMRRVILTARGGPVWFQSQDRAGMIPRAQLELTRDGEVMDVTVVAGHDLVGASGVSSALWADYASAIVEWRFWRPLRLFVGGNIYRNGEAPDVGWLTGSASSTGYALGGGAEWEVHRLLSLQLSLERYAELEAEGRGRLERNIASLRLNFRAF